MLTDREKGILLYIISHCNRILMKVDGLTKEAFLENDDAKEIVCFNILQIGELAKSLSDIFLLKYNEIPWPNIKGIRNRIVHGYGTIKFETIWKTSMQNVKPLKDYCIKILKEDA